MYTLLLPGRSHIISDEMADQLLAALNSDKAVESIRVEMNGEGSGDWDVIINVRQVIALVKHPESSSTEKPPLTHLRVVPAN